MTRRLSVKYHHNLFLWQNQHEFSNEEMSEKINISLYKYRLLFNNNNMSYTQLELYYLNKFCDSKKIEDNFP